MTQEHLINSAQPAPEIEALLAGADALSIVDRLMAIPAATNGDSQTNTWSRAVSQRLEQRISDRMKAVLGGQAA